MNKIDWTKWSAIAEIVSSVAIVLTLFYLVIQTQQNTAAIAANTRQAATDAEVEYFFQLAQRPDLVAKMLGDDAYDLTPAEQAEFFLLQGALFRLREGYWLQARAGTMEQEEWLIHRQVLVDGLGSEGVLNAWGQYTDELHPGFVEEIESLLIN